MNMSPAKIDPSTPPFFVRVARALAITTAEPPKEPDAFVAGGDFAAAQASQGTYQPKRAMSAVVANAWLYAACSQVESSLSALPLLVEVRDADGNWTADPDHDVARLLARPSATVTERQWRKQLVRYYLPNGWVCALEVGRVPGRPPAALLVLHPHRTVPIPGKSGEILAWEYDRQGATVRYAVDDVLFFTMPSTGDGPHGALLGTGWVQPMDRDIEADARLAESSARKAKRGRPDAVYRPADPKGRWNGQQVVDNRKQVGRLLKESDGGVAVMSGAGVFETLDWNMKEMQGAELRAYAREVVVAVTGVPPTMLGLQSANYATADMERKNYYEATLRPIAADLDDVLTNAARRWGYPDVRVRHDFSDVEALQEGRNERLDRVGKWVVLGASPASAAEYEGFDDAPDLAEIAVPPPEAAPATEPESDPEEERHARDLEIQARALAQMLVQDGVSDDEIRQEAQVLADLASRRGV